MINRMNYLNEKSYFEGRCNTGKQRNIQFFNYLEKIGWG